MQEKETFKKYINIGILGALNEIQWSTGVNQVNQLYMPFLI